VRDLLKWPQSDDDPRSDDLLKWLRSDDPRICGCKVMMTPEYVAAKWGPNRSGCEVGTPEYVAAKWGPSLVGGLDCTFRTLECHVGTECVRVTRRVTTARRVTMVSAGIDGRELFVQVLRLRARAWECAAGKKPGLLL
jgi:hypothetical protein